MVGIRRWRKSRDQIGEKNKHACTWEAFHNVFLLGHPGLSWEVDGVLSITFLFFFFFCIFFVLLFYPPGSSSRTVSPLAYSSSKILKQNDGMKNIGVISAAVVRGCSFLVSCSWPRANMSQLCVLRSPSLSTAANVRTGPGPVAIAVFVYCWRCWSIRCNGCGAAIHAGDDAGSRCIRTRCQWKTDRFGLRRR